MDRILILIVFLLCVNVPPDAFAINDTDDSSSFTKAVAGVSLTSGWQLFMPRVQNVAAQALKGVVIYDKNKSFSGYNLILPSNRSRAILMDMNGHPVYRWSFDEKSVGIFPYRAWGNARILPKGDLLALIPLFGLLKIDKNSRLIWFRKIICHHDFDIDSDGNIYTFTVRVSKSGRSSGLMIDSITVLSPGGEIKKNISLYDLFKKYPDGAYINKIDTLGRGQDTKAYLAYGLHIKRHGDVFHCNAIQVLDGKWASKIPAFKKGNLLISMRNLGVIACVDPVREKIVWLMDKVFWSKGQHFAKLLDNGNIMVFDNLYQAPTLSRVVEFDPAAKKIVWDYSSENGRFFSIYLGQCYRLPNGNTLIVESFSGHAFEITPEKKIVWEFYNPVRKDGKNKDSGQIGVINQLQRIPVDPTLDWLKS